ncbi:FGGY family carbohydrate kinase [Galbitalea sp. SE-J8]|uniref:FGGY-family carbohydrate kinase n=1 Tax=Galbitalea sp. SE-J8 TaxID=3054952 RepID=UPI00259CB9E7|nr:FGGY family carbohydrate kinase [Galbitalea sp. SE-J8]MDM4764203.1 FGGY family carbohydrate kinase [Galbitalea sp. SE-J8]
MPTAPLTLGIDVGTTGVKGVALDVAGGIVAQASRSSTLSSPHPGWAEASPAEWRDSVLAVVGELAGHARSAGRVVAGIATTGMVPAVVAVDARGRALRPAILQNDARASAEVRELADLLAGSGVLESTGSPVTQQSVAPTALWLRRNEPELWTSTAALVGSYDWVLSALGAPLHVERNWAIESGLFELDGRPFVPAVTVAGLEDRLVPVASPGERVGELSPEVASAVGLPAGIPLVAGGADHVLSAYGAGLAREGDWLVKLGGAGDILAVSARPVVDRRFYLDVHPMPGLWVPNGCMATSGSLVRWVQSLLREGDLRALDGEAAARDAAPLLCLPYFLGEKSPVNDPGLRGVFAGLHLGHDRYDLYRAALEGIAFGFRHNRDELRAAGLRLSSATITNGGATSALWKQIHASVLGVPLRTVQQHPGASLGAAVAAAIGTGALPGWSSVDAFVTPGETIEPDASAGRYDEAYALWRELADVTGATMRAFARL